MLAAVMEAQARPTVSVEDITINVQCDGSQRLQVHRSTKRAGDKPLYFLRATLRTVALTTKSRVR